MNLGEKYKLFLKLTDGSYSKIADEIILVEISYDESIKYGFGEFLFDKKEFIRINTTLLGIPAFNENIFYDCMLFSHYNSGYKFIQGKIKLELRENMWGNSMVALVVIDY